MCQEIKITYISIAKVVALLTWCAVAAVRWPFGWRLDSVNKKIVPSPVLGMIEIIRDDCYDNISNSRISMYVEMAVFCKHTAGT